MSINILYKAFFIVLLLTAVCTAHAQQRTTVKAVINKNQILIGEHIQLVLEAEIPENEPIRFFFIDTIPHFEFIEKQKIDTSDISDGTMLTQVITITSFDSGHWVIPSFVLRDDIATDSIPVDVGFSPFDPQQPYHDIKEIIEVDPEQSRDRWWLWYAIGGAVLLLALVLYLVFRKKKPIAPQPVAELDPYKEAISELDQLALEKTDPKQYYSRLVNTFRLYVLRKKGIHSLQKTTDDLVVQLNTLGIEKDQFDKLSQALRLSDFVKFAKFQPSVTDDQEALDVIRKAITSIEQIK